MQNRYTPLKFVGIALILFVAFIYMLTQCQGKEKELAAATNYAEVKNIWKKYESSKDEINWGSAIRQKVENLTLNQTETQDLDTWFPYNEYFNVVIAPDLSNRLGKTDQVKTDQDLIEHIWQCFKKAVEKKSKRKSQRKDFLMIDVTDKSQANGQFGLMANNLRFDLSTQTGVSTYLKTQFPIFKSNISKLYQLGYNHQSGSDIKLFIEDFANTGKEKTSTLSERYRNVLIILTDGYLETNKTYYTDPALNAGVVPVAAQNQISVNSGVNLSNWEVIILEVRERKEGRHYHILKDAWTKWLSAMGVKRIEFNKHLDASNTTKDFIESFFNVSGITTTSTTYTPPKPPLPPNNAQIIQLLTEAQTSIEQNNDFGKAKVFLRKAAQAEDLAENPKAQELANEWIKFGDSALEALTKTGDKNMLDIPKNWYELAQIINNTPEIQAKIQACK
jgi:hypothetical protein